MPSLLDVAPPEIAAQEFPVRGVKLQLRGVIAADWAVLYGRFPDLRRVVTGKVDGTESPVQMVAAQAALIAAGLGQLGDPDIERSAMSNLTGDEQRGITETILRLSLPGDVFSPLLDAAAPDAADASGRAADTK